MMAAARPLRLIDRMPAVRGRLRADVPLARYTWFRVGGPAEVLFEPADVDDLASFLAGCPADAPIALLGIGSNLLIRDGGVPGIVIRLGRTFARTSIDGTTLRAGAGATCPNVAKAARDAGLAGLEFLTGVPGSIGGAVRMNAGAYGGEIAAAFVAGMALDGRGVRHMLDAGTIAFAYRHSSLAEEWVVVEAHLSGQPDAPDAIGARMADIQARREASQPIRTRTGGSTFTNPTDPKAGGKRAWELIDGAGCRGLRRGGAMVSEKHCNFLINTGNASAADIEGLGEDVRRRVFEAFGVTLEWEIRRIGLALPPGVRPAPRGTAP